MVNAAKILSAFEILLSFLLLYETFYSVLYSGSQNLASSHPPKMVFSNGKAFHFPLRLAVLCLGGGLFGWFFYFLGKSVRWWTYAYCPLSASFMVMPSANRTQSLTKWEVWGFFLIYINWKSRKEYFVQSCSGATRFSEDIFPLWRISQELFLYLKSGKRKDSLNKHWSL